jgi:hypothetical protein
MGKSAAVSKREAAIPKIAENYQCARPGVLFSWFYEDEGSQTFSASGLPRRENGFLL